MARRLVFAPWTEENPLSSSLFNNMYMGFIGRVDNPNRARSLEETRMAVRILDALDSLTEVVLREGHTIRVLLPAGGTADLTDDCFRLLQQSVDAYVAQLPFLMARAGLAAKAFLDSSPVV